jgi:hypothetical protein
MTTEYSMPLRDAVERFRRERGSYGNAYEWYRKQAQRSGRVWMGEQRQLVSKGDTEIRAVKVGRTWMVNPIELEARLTEHRLEQAERQQITDDFEAHVLYGESGTVIRTSFGSYTVGRDFHTVHYDSFKPWKDAYAHWTCNGCWKPGSTEHNKPECHTCSNWGGCGRDCTLSRVFCEDCGTSMEI